MSSATPKRTRTERVQSLTLPPTRFELVVEGLREADVWVRLSLAGLAALMMLLICQAWQLPFAYRRGYIPSRDLVARVSFSVPDEAQTRMMRDQRRREALVYYENRPGPLNQSRAGLKDQLFLVLAAQSLDQMTPEQRAAWNQFYQASETDPQDAELKAFAALKATFHADPELKGFEEAVSAAQLPLIQRGLLQALQHSIEDGNQGVIQIFEASNPDVARSIEVEKVRIASARVELETRLREEMARRYAGDQTGIASALVTKWLVSRLPETLIYHPERSAEARNKAAASLATVMIPYTAGVTGLAPAGRPLRSEDLVLLRREWNQVVMMQGWLDKFLRMTAYFGMVLAMYMIVGGYIYFIGDRRVLLDVWQLGRLLGVSVITVGFCYFAARDQWQAEIIPITMAAIVATIAYGRELALILLAAIGLAVTLFIGQDVSDLVTLLAASLSSILFLGRIRSLSRLLVVGVLAAAVTAATVIGAGIITGQTVAGGDVGEAFGDAIRTFQVDSVLSVLVGEAVWLAGGTIAAALTMTGFLPLIERVFGVQTDLSLLQLGDASHPLLRQLAQRAPGTYNHSINVASIAEAAAEKIGANGLLVRVGAYFHDIGKIFKPDYFAENQGPGPSHHDSLQPAMSTLVIIAHVKDGADLARSHHLPEPMIDFILQHHGTTVVEYFFWQATKKSEEDPHAEEVADQDFRYPGPKPQTLEAAVLMLADAVESASRSLVDPTPSRISNLVETIAMKKLTDRQFDECGLTLMQLDAIKQSLSKSLTAIYHARVKYPGQQSA